MNLSSVFNALKTHGLRRSVELYGRNYVGRYYYAGNTTFYQRFIRSRYRQKAFYALKQKEPELNRLIGRMLESLGHDSNTPHKKHGDALFIMNYLLEKKPCNVLECGSGLTTLVFLYCMRKLQVESGFNSTLVSLEENETYLNELVLPAIPMELRSFGEFVVRQTAYDVYRNELTGKSYIGVYYQGIPVRHYDMIFVDGPAFRKGVEFLGPGGDHVILEGKAFNADCVNILQHCNGPVSIIIDQRIDTRWKLLELLSGNTIADYVYGAEKSTIVAGPDQVENVKRLSLRENGVGLAEEPL